ncbi:MAG: methionine--tRNA ligase, partial [Terriglobia bacterium]
MSDSDSKSKFYITTPIYYPNARPHVGSAYTTIVCDAIARYKRMCGYDVAFLTGTDEHGEKLQRAADAAGVPVEQFVAEKRELFKNLWRTLGISDYRFVHTSQNPDHVKAVHWMIRQADKAGYIEKKKYEGRYCIFDERYVSDSPEPANCDICGRPAELIREENYFFKLSAFETRLLKHYEDHPEFVLPSYRMNEVKSFVKSGPHDISISRRRLKWGIPWPDDPEQVVYVWYDALTSYLTGIGFRGEERDADFEKYWMGSEGPAEVVHMIGKDIIRFHAVYWPAFLIAAGLPLPKTIFAHGWIYYEQDKMSKSKGNVVYPEPIVQVFDEMGAPGNDALRYYLFRDTPFGQDGSFSYKGLIQRYNSDLANDLGNLANRTISMVGRYFGGQIPEAIVDWKLFWAAFHARLRARTDPELAEVEKREQAFSDDAQTFLRDSGTWRLAERSVFLAMVYKGLVGRYEMDHAIAVTLGEEGDERLGELAGVSQNAMAGAAFIAAANKYLSDNAPWRLAQEDFAANRWKIGTILLAAAEAASFAAVLLAPFLPEGAKRIWDQLGCEDYLGKLEEQRIDRLQWGQLKPGTKVGKPEPIFPRLDKAKTLARLQELAETDRLRDQEPKEASTKVEPQPEQKPAAVAPVSSPAPDGAGDSAATNQKITIDDFAKVDLRAGTVVSAEPIPGAKKLLKLMVDVGTEVRQVCAGIAEYYEPAQLVGMKIVLVANLAPRKLRGVESNGMVVAASVGENGRPV